jgi:hypothetical protein
LTQRWSSVKSSSPGYSLVRSSRYAFLAFRHSSHDPKRGCPATERLQSSPLARQTRYCGKVNGPGRACCSEEDLI